jgi:hypothetical protein
MTRRGATAWVAALMLLAMAPLGRAGDNIWAALVLGTNEHPPKPVPKELAAYAGGLREIFGVNSLYLLGYKKRKIVKGGEEWIVPTKAVFLKVRCLDRGAASYTLQLELYVKKRLVVTSKVKLARGAPLYIRGPEWGRGRLVFILEVR